MNLLAKRNLLMDSNANYDLLDVIGRGENTTVYRARDYALKRNVAIKELHERFRQDPRRLVQFCEEAQFLANLEHDNIVHVYGIDKQRGWMIMELMRGNLAAKAAEGPLSPELVRSIVRQVLEALQFLHEQGRVHGQIRPGNLLINDQGRVKLSDFVGTMAGKEFRRPAHGQKYLAPELLKPEFGPVGPAVDLYSLGFVALELLLGPKFESLFKGVGAGAVDANLAWMRWHTSAAERLPPAAKLVPGLPEDLAGAIDRMLEKQVSARCPSAAEALRLLLEKPLMLIEVAESPSAPVPAPPAKAPPPAPSGPAAPSKATGASNSAVPRKPLAPSKPAAAKFSKEWINEKLEKPWVLYPLCSLIVAATAYYLYFGGPSEKRQVKLKVEPADAKVLIDDQAVADGQLELTLGEHRFTISQPGYKKLEQKVVVEKGEGAQEVALALARQTLGATKHKTTAGKSRKVAIDVVPPEAEVFIDDAKRPSPPRAELELSPGKHRLRAAREGYEPLEQQIEVAAGEGVQKIALSLKRKSNNQDPNTQTHAAQRRKIKLVLEPAGAKLFVDGGREPTKVDAELELPLGEHRFRAELSGYQALERKVKVEAGKEPQRVELALTREPVSVGASRLPDDLEATADSKPGFEGLPERVTSKKLKAAGAPLEFALIPPGEFVFGSPDGNRWPGELPEEKLKIDEPFYISLVETTNRHYEAFAKAATETEAGTAWRALFAANPEETADWPVVMVSWEQASAFCRWLEGELPAERQWERAARGADGWPYPWGDRELDSQHANLRFASLGPLVPVSTLADGASPQGLRHLLGNAAEWCRDEYAPGAGDDGSTPGVQEKWHAIRGGSFKDPPAAARAMMRANCSPEGANDVGFRVAIPLKPRAPSSSAKK